MTTPVQNDNGPAQQAETYPIIRYESYLLRLRRVMEPTGERRQVCLIGIQNEEEHVFNSLRELMAYLRRCSREPEHGP